MDLRFLFVFLYDMGEKNGKHIHTFRTTCLFIWLFIDFIAVLHNFKNSKAFGNIPLLIRPKGLLHIWWYQICWWTENRFTVFGQMAVFHTLTTLVVPYLRANIHRDPPTSLSFIFRIRMETECNEVTMLSWYQAKASLNDLQCLNRCIDRFLVILNRFRGPRIDVVAPVLIQPDTVSYQWIVTPLASTLAFHSKSTLDPDTEPLPA